MPILSATFELWVATFGEWTGRHYDGGLMNVLTECMFNYKKASSLSSCGPIIMIIAIGWLLVSCAGRPPKEYTGSAEQLGKYWLVNGKIGCRSNQGSGSLNFVWHQQEFAYKARLTIPLSRIQIRLSGSPTAFQLIDNDGRLYDADEARQYLKELGSINMPIASLSYWLRGQPDPALPLTATSADGLLQSGWQLSWSKSASGKLPVLLQLSSELASCRIALRNWQPLKAPKSDGIVQ